MSPKLATQFLVLALEEFVPAKEIDGTMLRSGHEPGSGFVRDAGLRPLLKRGNEGILGELFGEPDIAHNPSKACDELGRLDPPDRVDRAMCVRNRHASWLRPSFSSRRAPGRYHQG